MDAVQSHRDEVKKWRDAHPVAERKRKRLYRAANRAYINAAKVRCEHCFTADNLEFHHVDPATKLFRVSQMTSWNRDRITTEINKCLVLCETCHKETH